MAPVRLLRARELLRCLPNRAHASSILASSPSFPTPPPASSSPPISLEVHTQHSQRLSPPCTSASNPTLAPWPWHMPQRGFSSKDSIPDSDDDFKPQYRKPDEATPIHEIIQQDITENPVMVYMKGTPAVPMCGFSGGVVQILNAYGVEFKSRNVLEDPDLRQGIKSFSQWPTIPQVFVGGEFVGGCDLLFKMHQDGELEGVFAKVKKAA